MNFGIGNFLSSEAAIQKIRDQKIISRDGRAFNKKSPMGVVRGMTAQTLIQIYILKEMLLTDQKVYPGFKALEYYRMWFNEGFCSQLSIVSS